MATGKIAVNRITNASIYIDGNALLGRAEEVKLPDVQAVMTEHKALGMVGKIELPAGMDKLEGEIKWNAFYPEVAEMIGNPFKSVSLQVRANVESYGAEGRTAENALVTLLTIQFKKNPLGTFKQHENAEFSSAFSATYVKQVIDGKEVLELDYMANIFRVNGVDVLDTFRINIGS
ncbi:MAG: phage major tail tube protein [Burkholderiaceae bacterium]|jgi:P2 family phage contractile tail tube protein|nr:phage major tail tube protein [Burkholderiaceae bacterium]